MDEEHLKQGVQLFCFAMADIGIITLTEQEREVLRKTGPVLACLI